MKKTCIRCGNEFDASNGNKKYCGRKCYHANRVGKERLSTRRRTIKICVVCGTQFETGGRAGSRDKFCSRKCQAVLRTHSAVANKMSDTDSAYFAGLMDGEGSIIIAKNKGGRNTWRATISNTDFDLLNWCKKVTGCGSIVRHENSNPLHATSGAWQCYSWNARSILKQLLPYLKIKEKIDRAVRMIAELDLITQEAGG
jgi:hypothetical protein